MERLWLDTDAHNARAQAAYRKAGFVEEGRFRHAWFQYGVFSDDIRMAMLRDEWLALPRPKSWELVATAIDAPDGDGIGLGAPGVRATGGRPGATRPLASKRAPRRSGRSAPPNARTAGARDAGHRPRRASGRVAASRLMSKMSTQAIAALGGQPGHRRVARHDAVVLLARVAVVAAGRRDRVVRDGDHDDTVRPDPRRQRVEDPGDVGLVGRERDAPDDVVDPDQEA